MYEDTAPNERSITIKKQLNMTKRRLYLFGLLLFFLGIINSCRNDHLQDIKVRNEEQNAKLTSRVIALSESPHKARLITELNQTKSLMSKTSTNALGKSVNYGDSISINTDEVIFMQNGNYHNYIFRIDKNNPIQGDPIDNLLLTPLPDGSYKEFLIQYYITEQEKQSFLSGNWRIPTNRIKITELLPGTYNNGQLVQTMDINCVYTPIIIGYLPCSQNAHFNGEGPSSCDAPKFTQADGSPGFLSQPVYGPNWDCTEVPIDESIYPHNPPAEEGGGSSGSGSGSGTTPTPCVQIPTDPNQPSTGIGDDGCQFIDPFIPNISIAQPNSPCGKVKSQFAKEKYKKKKDSIDKHEFYKKDKETGFREQKNGDLLDLPPSASTSNSDALTITITSNTIGYTHVHLDDKPTGETNEEGAEKIKRKIRIHSPADVNTLMSMANFNSSTGTFGDLYGTMLSRDGTYVIKFTGTATDINTSFGTTKEIAEKWRSKFAKYFEKNVGRTNETNFLLFLKDEMQVNGISLFKVKNNGSVFEIKLNEAGKRAISEKCSD